MCRSRGLVSVVAWASLLRSECWVEAERLDFIGREHDEADDVVDEHLVLADVEPCADTTTPVRARLHLVQLAPDVTAPSGVTVELVVRVHDDVLAEEVLLGDLLPVGPKHHASTSPASNSASARVKYWTRAMPCESNESWNDRYASRSASLLRLAIGLVDRFGRQSISAFFICSAKARMISASVAG